MSLIPQDDQNPISATVIQGLKNLGTEITLDLTKTLISKSLKLILHAGATITPVPELYANSADKTKHSEYSVVALYIIATKHGWDSLALEQKLISFGLPNTVVQELTSVYSDNRKQLTLRALQTGQNFPHITDIQWRIVGKVKSSTPDTSHGVANFYINLGQYQQGTGDRETIIEFLCNAEELQSLINRLKEIERHCDKLSS